MSHSWATCHTQPQSYDRAGPFSVTYSLSCHESDHAITTRTHGWDCPGGPAMVEILPAVLEWHHVFPIFSSHTSAHARQSKMDTFGRGVTLYLGRTHTPLCPVAALLNYLVLRGWSQGPLFLFQDGSTLFCQRLVLELRKAFACTSFDASGFNGHSFRIGAATTAAENGFEDSFIQMLGRWRSSAFTTYINTPVSTLLSASSRLLGFV